MGRPPYLDTKIKSKIATRIGTKDTTLINRMVYRKARDLAISSEAALIILAKEYDIGTSIYQRSLDATKQAEVRHILTKTSTAQRGISSNITRRTRPKGKTSKKRASRLSWLTLNPNLYGIGFNIKKIKWLAKWFRDEND